MHHHNSGPTRAFSYGMSEECDVWHQPLKNTECNQWPEIDMVSTGHNEINLVTTAKLSKIPLGDSSNREDNWKLKSGKLTLRMYYTCRCLHQPGNWLGKMIMPMYRCFATNHRQGCAQQSLSLARIRVAKTFGTITSSCPTSTSTVIHVHLTHSSGHQRTR